MLAWFWRWWELPYVTTVDAQRILWDDRYEHPFYPRKKPEVSRAA